MARRARLLALAALLGAAALAAARLARPRAGDGWLASPQAAFLAHRRDAMIAAELRGGPA